MALKSPVSSGLNPNAPLFVPYSYQIVEDFSPDWWKLVDTSPAFREYWLRERLPALEKEEELPLPDDAFPSADVEDLVGNPLNEDDILDDIGFIEDLQPPVQEDSRKLSDSVTLGMKGLSASLKLAGTMGAKMWLKHEPLVYFDKPPKLLPDVPRKSAIRRIQQPR